MRSIGLFRYNYEPCVYVRTLDDGSRIYLLLYVDDMLIACKSRKIVQELMATLSQKFEMKDLRLAKKILGMKIFRDQAKKLLHLSQDGYIKKVLERYGMKKAKLTELPIVDHFKLSKTMAL